MTEPDIVPATPDLVRQFCGENSPRTFRGYIALVDGKTVAIGGIYYRDGTPFAFADFKPGLSKKTRAQGFRFLEREFAKWRGRLFAGCDATKPSAERLLIRLGFAHTGQTVDGQPLMVRTS